MPHNNTNISVLEATDGDKVDESTHHEEPPRSLIRETLFVSVLCSSQLMTQAGLALSLVPLRIIGASFNTTNAGELSWYAASYSLTVGTFILIAGRLGDAFGHRLMFIIGFAWFSLWSLLGGIAVWSDQTFFDPLWGNCPGRVQYRRSDVIAASRESLVALGLLDHGHRFK
ncbi:hypothetical protein V2G26_018977 [Clonostachys chloroleuca]